LTDITNHSYFWRKTS